jgi:hypothetical protein
MLTFKLRFMEKQLFLIPIICFLSMCVTAQDIKQKEVTRIISTLAADDMQGRKTFTPGAEKAAVFIEQEFAKVKLSPLPGNTNFRQSFFHYEVKPGVQQLTVNGQAYEGHLLVLSAASHLQWDQDSDVESISLKAADNFYEYLGKVQRTAKRNTIVWVDTTHSKEFINYNNSIRENGRHIEDSGKSVILVLNSAAEIKTWSIKADQQVTPLPLFNIIGMIRGTTKPEEYVIFSAHYDHLGIETPVAGDSIANGADDDASGVTAIISMAAYYKTQAAPARTLLFIAFTGEEIGEHGSRYYAKHSDPDKIIAMFNIDMLGKTSKFGKNSIFITGYERSDFGAILKRNLKGSAFRVYADPYPEQHLFYRADNASLAKLGVPAHTISTARIDTDTLYHNVRDEVKTLDLPNLTNVIKGIINSARSIVNGTDTPARVDKKNV